MSYKIALASSDGKQIDETFGAAEKFIIYEVTEGKYKKLEERVFHTADSCKAYSASVSDNGCADTGNICDSAKGGCVGEENGCGSNTGGCVSTGNGCAGIVSGCGGAGKVSEKVELVSDCRCIVCKKIGFHIQKQLEQKAISAFDVECPAEEALEKITYYFKRIDNHESLRIQKKQESILK